MSEIRRDYLLDRWVIIATERAKRPTDFVTTRERVVEKGLCPFCPGNEELTPPAVLAYVPRKGEVDRRKDDDENRVRGWLVRCVPNLFPALRPSVRFDLKRDKLFTRATAAGHHEVVIESPNHNEHPGVARVSQLTLVVKAYLDRLNHFARNPSLRYVSIFRNHGKEAGASLSHAHTQIIASPIVPALIKEEVEASTRYHNESGGCIFCEIVESESGGPRVIFQNRDYVAFTPWASVHPFEFWLLPRRHMGSLSEVTTVEGIRSLARALRACFGGLRRLLNDPPYSCGFHLTLTTKSQYHWHLEVYPKLSEWAGFERSTRMFINAMSPEIAAGSLRGAIREELKEIK